MPRLPKPDGPYAVGTATHTLTDRHRPAHMLSDAPGRRLALKFWYPAKVTDEDPEPLWAELRQRQDLPLPLRWLLWRFRHVRTASHPGAAPHPEAPAHPLVVYSHGMVSFGAENTTLAEALASHGYPVLAIEHLAQMPELKALNRQNPNKGASGLSAAKALKRATPQERAQMGLEGFAKARNTNRIVAERAADIMSVLERIEDVKMAMPEIGAADRLISAGLSLGGAVASEQAAMDARVMAVVNLDGGLYGTRTADLPDIPYLMMYSNLTEGLNNALLPEQAERMTPPGTAHLNYHDIAMLMPELRLLGAVGRTPARAFVAHRNRTVLDFLNRTTRATP